MQVRQAGFPHRFISGGEASKCVQARASGLNHLADLNDSTLHVLKTHGG